MKNTILALLLSLTAVACGGAVEDEAAAAETTPATDSTSTASPAVANTSPCAKTDPMWFDYATCGDHGGHCWNYLTCTCSASGEVNARPVPPRCNQAQATGVCRLGSCPASTPDAGTPDAGEPAH